jgi:regulator of sigma D
MNFSCVHNLKVGFLSELDTFCNCVDVPYVVSGHFTILRHVLEKNKSTILPHSSEVFNNIIHYLALREIYMKG